MLLATSRRNLKFVRLHPEGILNPQGLHPKGILNPQGLHPKGITTNLQGYIPKESRRPKHGHLIATHLSISSSCDFSKVKTNPRPMPHSKQEADIQKDVKALAPDEVKESYTLARMPHQPPSIVGYHSSHYDYAGDYYKQHYHQDDALVGDNWNFIVFHINVILYSSHKRFPCLFHRSSGLPATGTHASEAARPLFLFTPQSYPFSMKQNVHFPNKCVHLKAFRCPLQQK